MGLVSLESDPCPYGFGYILYVMILFRSVFVSSSRIFKGKFSPVTLIHRLSRFASPNAFFFSAVEKDVSVKLQ